MSDGLMSEVGDRLVRERAEIAARAVALRADVDSIIDSATSTTGDDEHDPEGATVGFERAQALALVEQAEAHLVAIDGALQRVADGNYGTCVTCGNSIAPERLDARPEAAECIRCAASRS